jgi:hypothetical protein
MKPEEFSVVARRFHAREKKKEEAYRKMKEQEREDGEFYDILGMALDNGHECVSFPREPRNALLDGVQLRDNIVLKFKLSRQNDGDPIFQYIIDYDTEIVL